MPASEEPALRAAMTASLAYAGSIDERPVAPGDAAVAALGAFDEALTDDGADTCVVCPWHGGKFDLRDGSVVLGPPTRPAAAFEVREVDGRLQARRVDARSLRTNPVGR